MEKLRTSLLFKADLYGCLFFERFFLTQVDLCGLWGSFAGNLVKFCGWVPSSFSVGHFWGFHLPFQWCWTQIYQQSPGRNHAKLPLQPMYLRCHVMWSVFQTWGILTWIWTVSDSSRQTLYINIGFGGGHHIYIYTIMYIVTYRYMCIHNCNLHFPKRIVSSTCQELSIETSSPSSRWFCPPSWARTTRHSAPEKTRDFPKWNILKINGWKMIHFLLGWQIFRGYGSFKEGLDYHLIV